jgi:YegS/Rv2252/BmrU family lipid kinase
LKTLVVVNPNASHGEAGKDFEKSISSLLREEIADYDIHITTGPEDALNFVTKNPNYDRIISVGGDGTLNEIVNGMIKGKSNASVGIVALGSGNDLARTINLKHNYREMVRIAAGENVRKIDLLKVSYVDMNGVKASRYAVNVVGAGFDAAITVRMNKSRFKTSGKMAYLLSFLMEFFTSKTYPLTFIVDGEETSDSYFFLTMANGNYFGGGMRIAPKALVDDGYFDVVGVSKMSKLRLLYHFPKIYRGEHLVVDTVSYRTAKNISLKSDRDVIIQMDGEVVGSLPMEISICEKALKIASA